MFSSTTLVCIVDPICIVDLMCIVDHMCLLECNVCGGITAVAFSCCGILRLTLCGSTFGPAWYPSCPVISGKLPSSGLLYYLWFISVCVGHLSTVFTPSRHCFYSTESIFYFFAACPIYPAKASHYYRPTSVATASVHIVKGITKNIHKMFTNVIFLSCSTIISFFFLLRDLFSARNQDLATSTLLYNSTSRDYLYNNASTCHGGQRDLCVWLLFVFT